ncbi:uncharacterized protein DS421_18g615060 [Arachis hypogaea]|nr:uncharacterized protein DS421_18g615060 [Arachis hypogaea]
MFTVYDLCTIFTHVVGNKFTVRSVEENIVLMLRLHLRGTIWRIYWESCNGSYIEERHSDHSARKVEVVGCSIPETSHRPNHPRVCSE